MDCLWENVDGGFMKKRNTVIARALTFQSFQLNSNPQFFACMLGDCGVSHTSGIDFIVLFSDAFSAISFMFASTSSSSGITINHTNYNDVEYPA